MQQGAPVDGYTRRALEVAAEHGSDALLSWAPGRAPQRTRSGITVARLQQMHGGIPVRGCQPSVRFPPRGGAASFSGRVARIDPDASLQPACPVRAAVYAACRHLADEVIAESFPEVAARVSNRRPRILAELGGAAEHTALSKIPFEGSIRASLVILPDDSELAWEVILQLPAPAGAYTVLVAATDAEARVLAYERRSAHAVEGRVWAIDPDTPTVVLPFPRPRADHPPLGGAQLGRTAWCDLDEVKGNNVVCVDDRGRGFRAAPTGADLRFEAADPLGLDQAKVNAFYLCNYLHDLFWLLGFDEQAGNFQRENAPGTGEGGDPLRVTVWNAVIPGRAFYVPQPDGAMAELHFGRLGAKHTALDAGVVTHEFVHGVTSRVIGTPANGNPLTRPQSRALGEGYSDYFAITIVNRERRAGGVAESGVYGGWVSSNAATGLRPLAYDPGFARTYGHLPSNPAIPDHDAGQIWCAALLDVHRALAARTNVDTADEQAWQVVFDSLRLIDLDDRGPTFLDARDAFFTEVDGAIQAGRLPADPAFRTEVSAAFTRRGMGPNALSPDASFHNIVEDLGP